MTVDEIRELINLVVESGIAELEVHRGENKVRVRRTVRGGYSQEIMAPTQSMGPAGLMASPMPAARHAPQPPAAPAAPPQPAAPEVDENSVLVKSPIVGTYYDAPAPGAPAFVKVGDTVQPGQVLCIIESMKLMNEIEAEVSGILVSKLVANGRPVEYGEALFALKPA
jgi:acetyl-CoA carboxylase biotin carboxyl carrier protein